MHLPVVFVLPKQGEGLPPSPPLLRSPGTLRQQKHSIKSLWLKKAQRRDGQSPQQGGVQRPAGDTKRCSQGQGTALARGLLSVAFPRGLGVSSGRPRPHETWAMSTAASHRGDEPVPWTHQDKTGKEAPEKHPQQNSKGPPWFRFTWSGHSQRDKHRGRAKSTWRGENQEPATLL